MSDISIHRTRTQFAAAVDSLQRAVTFKAWRVPLTDASPALPLDIGQPDTLQDALNEALIGNCLGHKETLLILREDAAAGAAMLYSYAIRRQSKPTWVRGPHGVERSQPLYPELTFSLPVDAFAPVRPFDAFRDDPVGRDLTLVEQR